MEHTKTYIYRYFYEHNFLLTYHLHGSVEILHDEVARNAAQTLNCGGSHDPSAVKALEGAGNLRSVRDLDHIK